MDDALPFLTVENWKDYLIMWEKINQKLYNAETHQSKIYKNT